MAWISPGDHKKLLVYIPLWSIPHNKYHACIRYTVEPLLAATPEEQPTSL